MQIVRSPIYIPGGHSTQIILDKLREMGDAKQILEDEELYSTCLNDPSTFNAIEDARLIKVERDGSLADSIFTSTNSTNRKVVVGTFSEAIQGLQSINQGRKVCVLHSPSGDLTRINITTTINADLVSHELKKKHFEYHTNFNIVRAKYVDDIDTLFRMRLNRKESHASPSLIKEDGELRQIYSPNVSLYTNKSNIIAVIETPEDDRGLPTDESYFPAIIRGILQTAMQLGYKDLVIGAIGCSRNDVNKEEIAKLFKRELDTTFKNQFENVVFAITDHRIAAIFEEQLAS